MYLNFVFWTLNAQNAIDSATADLILPVTKSINRGCKNIATNNHLPACLAPRAPPHMQKKLETSGKGFMTVKSVRMLAAALQAACPLRGRVFSDVSFVRVCEVRERLGANAYTAAVRATE